MLNNNFPLALFLFLLPGEEGLGGEPSLLGVSGHGEHGAGEDDVGAARVFRVVLVQAAVRGLDKGQGYYKPTAQL